MTTVAPLTDFSDKYSPMVVKELRQGLRTKMFGGMMLGVHAILLLITLAGLSSTRGQEKDVVNGIINFGLYVIFPLSAFSALAGEIKANTMDMLVLSRLSAGRIVFGKWAAVVLQSLLLTISIVPYMVARYFFGGASLLGDLYFLANTWLGSTVLTAAVVALSTQKQFWLRGLMVALPLLFSGITRMALLMGSMWSGSVVAAENTPWIAFFSNLPIYAWLVFAFLSLAATRVAPASSMLSVPKRLVNLAALILLPLLQWLTTDSMTPVLIVAITILAAADALTEQVRPISSIYIPFYKRSWWGRVSGGFLAPGWMHGFIYSLLVVAIAVVMTGYLIGVDEATQIFFIGCGVWLVALISQLLSFWREESDYLAAFIGGILILALMTLVVGILANSALVMESNRWVLGILPTTAITLLESRYAHAEVVPIAVACNAVWPVFLALFAFRAFRKTRAVRQEAKSLVSHS